jgi:hypothetical protein
MQSGEPRTGYLRSWHHHHHYHHHHLTIRSCATIIAGMAGARKVQQILTEDISSIKSGTFPISINSSKLMSLSKYPFYIFLHSKLYALGIIVTGQKP